MSRTPHDKLFKRIFKEPQHAADELRLLLPPALVEAIDWESLRVQSESHIEPTLKGAYSDLIFTATAGEDRLRIYVLFEHQSSNDERMALRLLDYMVKTWMAFIEDETNAGQPLPVVVPVVLSHAPGGWKAKRRFSELFSPRGVALTPESVPDFVYLVDDLSKVSADALRLRPVRRSVKLTLWVLRTARDGPSFLSEARAWVSVLESIAQDRALAHVAQALVAYLLSVLDDEIMDAFRVILEDEAPAAKGLTMTYAEKLLAQGRERGLREGERKGMLEGERKGQTKGVIASLLLVLEARGFALDDPQRRRVEACEDVETVRRWLQAAATAASVDDVFGG